MLAYFAKERAITVALLAVVALGCIFGVAAPAFQSQAVDAIAALATAAAGSANGAATSDGVGGAGNTGGTFTFGILIMLACYMAYSACQLGQGVISAHLSTRIVGHMRNQLFGRVIDLPLGYVDRHSRGDLMSRMTNDIELISLTITEVLPSITSGALTLVGTLGIMLWFSWQLTALSLVSVVLTVAATRFLSGRVRRYSRQRQTLLGQVNGQVEETINGFAAVSAFNQQRAQTAAFCQRADALTRAGILCESFGGVTGPVMNCINNLGFVLICAGGGLLALHGVVTVGVISAFVVYARQLGRPVEELSMVYGQLQAAAAAAERVFSVLDQAPEDMSGECLTSDTFGNLKSGTIRSGVIVPDGAEEEMNRQQSQEPPVSNGCASDTFANEGGTIRPCVIVPDEAASGLIVPREATSACVSFERVTFGYDPARPVLHDFSLTVPAGRKVALVGATGSGKTTVVSLLERFYDPQAGRICIDGQDIAGVSRASLRQHVAIVLQDSAFVTDTVAANLRYARVGATDDELWAAARESLCADMIAAMPEGMNTVLERGGAALSAGQRQLLSIARAFVANPRVLVLDEATSNVDTRTERAVQRAMQRIMQARTSIVIAHRLSTIEDADQIVVMDAGQIVETGTHARLLAAGGTYARLYQTQFAGQEI
jgi:ATP-binding cassette subfamily B protein